MANHSSIQHFIAQQQQHPPLGIRNRNGDVIISNIRLSDEPDEESINVDQLSPEEMETLRKSDPFMYHSIANEISGRKVCDFGRSQSGTASNADFAGGGVDSSVHDVSTADVSNQDHAQRARRRNTAPPLRECTLVRRQRRFSTEAVDDFETLLELRSGEISNIDDFNEEGDEDILLEMLTRITTQMNVGEVEGEGNLDE